MAGKGLTECWREAMAAKPSTWDVKGLACGPREIDPAIRGKTWVAWARGPDGERLQGGGESPEDALLELNERLRGLNR